MIVYISIGNSDDKLQQHQWANFIADARNALDDLLSPFGKTHGEWFSAPDARWQNACWCVEFVQSFGQAGETVEQQAARAKLRLRSLAREFGQDSIAWAEAPVTEFLGIETPEESAALVDFNLKNMGWAGLGALDA